MLDLPDSAVFAATVTDPRFAFAVFVSVLSGVVRGFSGFGSALIYVPLMSAAYGPKIGAASFLLIDFATGLAFALGVWRRATWGEVMPLAAAAVAAAQLGTLILQYADPTLLRWTIAVMVGVLVPVLASGWRYHGRPRLAVTLAVGVIAGVLGGAVQISGPPVVLYWLGSAAEVAVVRANFIVFFALFAAALVATYVAEGLVTAEVVALAALIGPLHVLGMWVGGRLFRLASEGIYRRIAYVVIALAALASMPVLDGWRR